LALENGTDAKNAEERMGKKQNHVRCDHSYNIERMSKLLSGLATPILVLFAFEAEHLDPLLNE
jgi:hypothetical protein